MKTSYSKEKRGRSSSDRYSEKPSRQSHPHRDDSVSHDNRTSRRSFNPNFTRDNRIRKSGPVHYSDRSHRDDERWDREEEHPGRSQSFGPTSKLWRDDRRNTRDNSGFSKSSHRRGDSLRGDRQNAYSYTPNRDKYAPRRNDSQRFGRHDSDDYPSFSAPKRSSAIRLNRFLANSGICSRREADDLITAGVVSVNGRVVSELGTKVFPTDEVRFNDELVRGERQVYILMNKPKGFVTSLDDPHADKTVMDLVRNACTERVYPVGRLDKNSTGVLLITNDGDLTRQLTHPSYNKRKVYQVSLSRPLSEEEMQRIADGIELEDGMIYADEISYVDNSRQEIGIEIHSGRNRIVRRIFVALGHSVRKLDRVYFAGLTKKGLKRGAWRFLTPREVSMLKSGEYQ